MPEVWPGEPYPLGAVWDGTGTNVSLYSPVAERVELCIFDEKGNESRVTLPEIDGYCWHGYLPGMKPGTRYGFRVYGPYDPAQGLRCNPSKLLLDPYAKAVDGDVIWHPALYPYVLGQEDTVRDDQDSAPYMPKAIVADSHFDWGHDRQPRTPWHQTVVYETHVKGLTATHEGIPPEQRGTYAGLAHPVMIDYLTNLGVTAVELMPIHQFIHDHRLEQLGLTNY